MQTFTKLYPTVECNGKVINEANLYANEYAQVIEAQGHCGYFLANGLVIPYSFFNRMANHLFYGTGITYGEVYSPQEIVGEAVWSSLTQNEQAAVGPCLMILIERGDVGPGFELNRVKQ